MADKIRNNTFLIKRSNVPGKVPTAGSLLLGELALNTSDVILYASGTTANSILPIGWDRVSRTGDTMTGGLFTPFLSATTISATSIDRVDYIVFNTGTTSATTVPGTIYFDNTEKALSYNTSINQGVTVNLGQQNYIRVFNNSGADIARGKALEILSAYSGLPAVTLAINNHEGFNIIGVSAEIIPNGKEGIAITNGIISNIELTGMTVGSLIYASDNVPGNLDDATKYLSFPLTARTNQIGFVVQTGVTTGKLFVNINNENSVLSLTDLERNVLEGNTISTGVFEYTGMTTASTTTFNVAPLKGWLVKNTYTYALLPDVQSIEYTGGTNIPVTNILTSDSTYILINSGLTITQQVTFPTPQERRENIFLGEINHPNRTSILNINNTVDYDVSPMSSLRDLWSPIRLINDGIIPSPNGANLSFNTSAGSLWGNGINWHNNQLNPNNVSIAAKVPASFFYRTQTGGTTSSVTVIDPRNYDVGGVITSIGNANLDSATNQRIYLYPTGTINVLYGQTVYTNLAAAVAAVQSEAFIPYTNATNTGILIGVLSVRNDIGTDGQPLTNASYAKFTFASKFGESFGGTGGLSTTTLQQAYDNSSTPEIVINAALDGLSIQNGTGNADNVTRLLEGINSAGAATSFIRADGDISGTTLQTNGFTGNSTGMSALTVNIRTIGSGTPITNLGIDSLGNVVSGTTGGNGSTFTGGTVNGPTNFTNGLTANTISATTYYNLPLDIRVTGASYSNNTFTYTNNTGGTFNVLFNTVTGLTVNGNLTVTGNTSLQALTGTSAVFSGSGANILTVIGSGSTTSPIFSVQGSTGATIFSISDSTSGPLFWVDTALDVPIMEVYDTSPNLIIYGGISASTLTASTISATTYLNLPLDIRVTGSTYSNNTFTFRNNTGGTFNVLFNTVTGLTVNGNLTVTGNTTSNSLSATTITGGTFYGNGSGLTGIPIAGVTNLQSSLDNKFDKSGGTVTGSVLITGDVTILGTATTINTQTLTIKDNIITINSNYTGNTVPYPGTSGIEVLRGSATTATLLWDETSQKWVAGITGNTKQILFSGDSLSLLSSGHTHPISEIINLQSSLDSKFDKTGGTISGNLTVTGDTISNSVSATTITGTTIYGNGSNLTGVVKGTGTNNYLAKWTGTTGISNSIIQDNGTNTSINSPIYPNSKLTVVSSSGNFESTISAYNSNTGSTGVRGTSFLPGTIGTIYGLIGEAFDAGTTNIGVYGYGHLVDWTAPNAIGGKFEADSATNNYSLQLIDGTEGLNKVLVSKTTDGKANWSDVLSGLTRVNATTISATTYQNLPATTDTYVTGFTYSNNTYTLSRNNGLSALTQTVNTMTGLTITGNLIVSGGTQSRFSGNSSSELVLITQTGTGDAFVVEDSANSDPSHFVINASGNTAIGLLQPTGNDKLSVSGNTTIYGVLSATTVYSNSIGVKTTTPSFDLEVNGTFGATSKSFVIKHPTQEGKRLVYGAIEGPEFGVYVRGKVDGDIIELPEEWVGLVDENSITVQLTGDGMLKLLYVKKIKDNKVYISNMIPFIKSTGYYTVYGERKDIDKIKKVI